MVTAILLVAALAGAVRTEAAVTSGATAGAFLGLCALRRGAEDAAVSAQPLEWDAANASTAAKAYGGEWAETVGAGLGTLGLNAQKIKKQMKDAWGSTPAATTLAQLEQSVLGTAAAASEAKRLAAKARFGAKAGGAAAQEGPDHMQPTSRPTCSRPTHKKGRGPTDSNESLAADMTWLCNTPTANTQQNGCGGTTGTTCPCMAGTTKNIVASGTSWTGMVAGSASSLAKDKGGTLAKNWLTSLNICEHTLSRRLGHPHPISALRLTAQLKAVDGMMRQVVSNKNCLAAIEATTCSCTGGGTDQGDCVCYVDNSNGRRPPWEARNKEIAVQLEKAQRNRDTAIRLAARFEQQITALVRHAQDDTERANQSDEATQEHGEMTEAEKHKGAHSADQEASQKREGRSTATQEAQQKSGAVTATNSGTPSAARKAGHRNATQAAHGHSAR
ncbi:Trypanosomal VSG domain [Trypanosoma vivax]|nr:Trypanosomal VSG domain [Trypanosoma vivax]